MSGNVLEFPYGGRDGRSVADPMPPLPAPTPVRVIVHHRWNERRFGGLLPVQEADAVVIYCGLRSDRANEREEAGELLACVRALQHVKGHPQAPVAREILARVRGLFDASMRSQA